MHSTRTERKQKKRKKWTWKIERDIGPQDEVKEAREKPELYVIQSLSQIIFDEVRLIWLKTIGK